VSTPYPVDGGFVNVWPCNCSRSTCGCADYAKLPFPFLPARGVTDVTIAGVSLAPTAYTIVGDYLYRLDGQPWPSANSLTNPDIEWTVTYTFGSDIPPEAKPLIAQYACQLFKLCRRQPCDLPVDMYRTVGPDAVVVEDLSVYRDQVLTGYRPLDDWIMLIRGGRTIHTPRMIGPTVPLAPLGG